LHRPSEAPGDLAFEIVRDAPASLFDEAGDLGLGAGAPGGDDRVQQAYEEIWAGMLYIGGSAGNIGAGGEVGCKRHGDLPHIGVAVPKRFRR
jgi:hypothetical protein